MSDMLSRLVRVEVLSAPVIPGRTGTKDGRAWSIPAKQEAALWQEGPFPTRLEIVVPDSGPYRPGVYLLTGQPFNVASVNNRVVVRFDDRAAALVPLEEVAAALAKSPSVRAA